MIIVFVKETDSGGDVDNIAAGYLRNPLQTLSPALMWRWTREEMEFHRVTDLKLILYSASISAIWMLRSLAEKYCWISWSWKSAPSLTRSSCAPFTLPPSDHHQY